MDKQKDFDAACKAFTRAMREAAGWRSYFGAAYSTRLAQAIKNAREACDEMERAIKEDIQ